MKKRYFLASLSGLSLFISFAPLNVWPAAFVGMALLFKALSDQRFMARLFLTSCSGALLFFPLLYWSGNYVGAVPWIALSTLETTLFSLISIPSYKRDCASVVRFAAIFSLIEIVRMKFPFGGFGWGRIGFTQIDSLGSFYPVIGITGITFLVALSGAFLTLFFIRSIVVVLSAIFLSQFLPHQTHETTPLTIDAVQGGVDQLGLDFNSRALSVLSRHVSVTEQILHPAQLIIFPENASDIDPLKDQQAQSLIDSALTKTDRPILLGAVEEGERGPLNTSLLFDVNGNILSRYVKQDLTPFGEYIPLRTLAQSVSPAATRVTNFQPGTQWVLHHLDGQTFPSIICFELLDDDHLRKGMNGATFAIAQTNNATFGKSAQADQQLQITQARAAEFGREFAVVSTTGWTAQIDSYGRVVKRLERFTPGYLSMSVMGMNGETSASRSSSRIWAIFFVALMLVRRRSI